MISLHAPYPLATLYTAHLGTTMHTASTIQSTNHQHVNFHESLNKRQHAYVPYTFTSHRFLTWQILGNWLLHISLHRHEIDKAHLSHDFSSYIPVMPHRYLIISKPHHIAKHSPPLPDQFSSAYRFTTFHRTTTFLFLGYLCNKGSSRHSAIQFFTSHAVKPMMEITNPLMRTCSITNTRASGTALGYL